MMDHQIIAEVNIRLRARSQDRELIDQAAKLVGSNRSQFYNGFRSQGGEERLARSSTIFAGSKIFQKVMDWMDTAATPSETEGMKRILQAKVPWHRD